MPSIIAVALALFSNPYGCARDLPEHFTENVSRMDAQGRCLAVAESYALADSRGYWFLVRKGTTWNRPTYLDLRVGAPYVIDEILEPGLTSDDKLHVMVRGMAEPLVLDIQALRHDADGDGLPDRQELHMFLDSTARDTDKDGISDVKDPLPNVAAGKASELTDIWSAAIAFLADREEWSSDLYIIHGDREAMRGLHAPKRTIVLSNDEIATYAKTYGHPDVIDFSIRHDGRSCTVERLTRSSGIELAGKRHPLLGWQFTVVTDWVE
jgi:hypothetical protein